MYVRQKENVERFVEYLTDFKGEIICPDIR